MITVLYGDNDFEITRKLARIVDEFEGVPERIDASEVAIQKLPDLFMGVTLFTDRRLVIMTRLASNKVLWNGLETWLERLSDEIHLVLVETQIDKRTKTYKQLQKQADIHEYTVWTERDTAKAEDWVASEATHLGFRLNKKSAHTLVVRVGVDQWRLYRALEKLAVVEEASPQVIEHLIDAHPAENVFHLFEAALKQDGIKVKKMMTTLELTEDPYKVFGLLSGQVFQLVMLGASEKSSAEIARDIGAHPFVISKLAPYSKKRTKGDIKKIVAAFAEADHAMKTSATEPWLLIERALIKVACI